ncbi:small ribosomal subunit Rsm22 family protein [Ruania zhangjianzhongii]|uniref:small ribosomal subunit Rsm22 family protein n=1 Tax=Ruania zhangjianzhongii TaxID=2603206 RepID=UPI0011C88848|nr:small ribosomal subunit Rsm22 family protein [Ruania zhangjianzhongii]
MHALPEALNRAVDAELAGYDRAALNRAARALSERYLADRPAQSPIVSDRLRAAAYLLTRMPATYAAARSAVDELAVTMPDWRPQRMVDLGAGTGAASWATVAALDTIESVHLVDYADSALDLATRLLTDAPVEVSAERRRLGRPAEAGFGANAPEADLAVAAYVLSELSAGEQSAVVTELTRSAPVILLLEPGTPAGYARILRVRDQLIGSGWRIAAPCPHQQACPLTGDDWCHMSVRLPRTIAHRQAKGGSRDFEDEKFSYLAATTLPTAPVGDRVLRHPQVRPGHVRLELCTTAGAQEQVTVSKKQGAHYRQARRVEWGQTW